MTLSLDSNVLIDLSNGDLPEVRQNLVAARRRGDRLHVCPQAVHEVTYGALISARPLHQTEVLHRLLTGLAQEPFLHQDAQPSAELRAERRRLGKPMGAVDAMIAAQALARGWTLVTADEDDFSRIPGLPVVNWRTGPTRQDS